MASESQIVGEDGSLRPWGDQKWYIVGADMQWRPCEGGGGPVEPTPVAIPGGSVPTVQGQAVRLTRVVGVIWTLGGTDYAAADIPDGTRDVSVATGSHTVTARAASGYVLTSEPTTWTLTIAAGAPFQWLAGSPPALAGDPAAPTSGYRTEAALFKDPAGATFIPRGSNIGTDQFGNGGGYPYFGQDSTFADDFKARGGNTVRLVMYGSSRYSWSPFVTGFNGKTGTAACVDAFAQFIDFWRAKGVIAIPECHDFTSTGWTEQQMLECEALLAALADRYKADTGVWLNPYNEPNVYTSYDSTLNGNVEVVRNRWAVLTGRACKAIRDTGNTNIIVMDTFAYAGDSGKQSDGKPSPRGFDPGAGPLMRTMYGNVALSWHNYGHHGVLVTESNINSYINKVTGSDAGQGQAGLPLIIGELGYPVRRGWDGVSSGAPWLNMLAAVDRTYTVAPGRGIGILNWASNFKDGFSLYIPFWTAPTSGRIINEFAATLPEGYSLSGQGAKHMTYLAAPTTNQPYTVSHDGGATEQ